MPSKSNKNTTILHDIAYIRTLAIISVVLYHSYCPYLDFNYVKSELSPIYSSIFNTWLEARMPLFIFISGYLFSFLLNKKGKYKSAPKFIFNKIKRLIIPYVFFAILFIVLLKTYYDTDGFINGYYHLWFLLMLFSCFIITRLLAIIAKKTYVQLTILTLVIIIRFYWEIDIKVFSLDKLIIYYLWFWLGYIFVLNKSKIDRIINLKSILALALIWILTNVIKESFLKLNVHLSNLNYFLFIMSSLLFIFSLINYLLRKKILKPNPVIDRINNYSYGIFVFHGMIIVYLFAYNGIFGNYFYQIAERNPISFPILLFLSVFILSSLITHFLLKIKIGRFLIG